MRTVSADYAFLPKDSTKQRRIFVVREDDVPQLPYAVYVEITEAEQVSGVTFKDIMDFVKREAFPDLYGGKAMFEEELTKQLLEERQETHGDFAWVAEVSQELKEYFRNKADWYNLTNVQREALDNIAQKTARIFSGNPNFADHWVDIQGYAKLAEKEIRKGEQA